MENEHDDQEGEEQVHNARPERAPKSRKLSKGQAAGTSSGRRANSIPSHGGHIESNAPHGSTASAKGHEHVDTRDDDDADPDSDSWRHIEELEAAAESVVAENNVNAGLDLAPISAGEAGTRYSSNLVPPQQPKPRKQRAQSRTERSPAPTPPSGPRGVPERSSRVSAYGHDDHRFVGRHNKIGAGHGGSRPASATDPDEEPATADGDRPMDEHEYDEDLYAPPSPAARAPSPMASPHFSENSKTSHESLFSHASHIWSPPQNLPARRRDPLTCTFFWDHTITTCIDLDFTWLRRFIDAPMHHSVWCQLRNAIAEALQEDGYILRYENGEHDLYDIRVVWPYHGGWCVPNGHKGIRRETKLQNDVRLLRMLQLAVQGSPSVYLEFKIRDRESREILRIEHRPARRGSDDSDDSQSEHSHPRSQRPVPSGHRPNQNIEQRPGGPSSEDDSFHSALAQPSSDNVVAHDNAGHGDSEADQESDEHDDDEEDDEADHIREEVDMTSDEMRRQTHVSTVMNSQKLDRGAFLREQRRRAEEWRRDQNS